MNLGLDREETAADRLSQSVDADGDLPLGPLGPWPSAGRTLFSSEETDSC